jgi:mannose-6-phosphate isomerase-like protein (cupin superfamily)
LEKKRLENFGHSNKFYDIKDKIISGTQLSKFMELYVPRLEHIVNIEDVEKIRDTCGYIRELYVDNTMSLAYVNLSGKAKEHKHNVMQEVYYIIKGNGTITINEKTEDIWRGDLITIPKNSWHYLTGRGELELLVVTSPRFDPKDVILK